MNQRLSYSLAPVQQLTLRLKQSLSQMILTQQILSSHPLALDSIIGFIENNPQECERKLLDKNYSGNASDIFGKINSMFGDFIESDDRIGSSNEEQNSGFAISFPLKEFSGFIKKDKVVKPISDVNYTGRKNEKPEVKFANHLTQAPKLELKQLDKFPESKKLYKLLFQERQWINSTLREFYVSLGNSQRQFIYSLNPVQLQVYQLRDSAKELGVHHATVSRLRKGRYVSITSQSGDKQICSVCSLMPNVDNYKKILFANRLNEILQNEAENKRAKSDDYLAVHSGIARRTVTKYRAEAGIPNLRGREIAYRTDPKRIYQINAWPF